MGLINQTNVAAVVKEIEIELTKVLLEVIIKELCVHYELNSYHTSYAYIMYHALATERAIVVEHRMSHMRRRTVGPWDSRYPNGFYLVPSNYGTMNCMAAIRQNQYVHSPNKKSRLATGNRFVKQSAKL